MQSDFGDIVERSGARSCWRATFRALTGFMAVLALAYLFGIV